MNIKKPKFWDYDKPNIFAYILYPISFLIEILTLFNFYSKNKKTKIKTICVGNIYVGGTGKTSLSIKINQILKKNKIKSCFIKKFYKKHSDENKILENNGKLFLTLKRAEAIEKAEKENYQIAIFDDGLQDKSIDYDLSFVCFNNINWIGNGMTIPAGPLRENIKNLKNYSHVFLNGNLENLESLKREVLKLNSKINIHVGKYKALNINDFKKNDKYLVFSGIGNHQTFTSMIKKYGLNILKDIEFPDHYKYTQNDIKKIINKAKNLSCKIITTEKDYLRSEIINKNNIQFIKTELEIMDEDKLIKSII